MEKFFIKSIIFMYLEQLEILVDYIRKICG